MSTNSKTLFEAIAAADKEIESYGAVTTGTEPRYQELLYGPTSDMPERVVRAVLETLSPRTIITAAELDSLPPRSVVVAHWENGSQPDFTAIRGTESGSTSWAGTAVLGGAYWTGMSGWDATLTVLYEAAS